jgi:hypothetical protein
MARGAQALVQTNYTVRASARAQGEVASTTP